MNAEKKLLMVYRAILMSGMFSFLWLICIVSAQPVQPPPPALTQRFGTAIINNSFTFTYPTPRFTNTVGWQLIYSHANVQNSEDDIGIALEGALGHTSRIHTWSATGQTMITVREICGSACSVPLSVNIINTFTVQYSALRPADALFGNYNTGNVMGFALWVTTNSILPGPLSAGQTNWLLLGVLAGAAGNQVIYWTNWNNQPLVQFTVTSNAVLPTVLSNVWVDWVINWGVTNASVTNATATNYWFYTNTVPWVTNSNPTDATNQTLNALPPMPTP